MAAAVYQGAQTLIGNGTVWTQGADYMRAHWHSGTLNRYALRQGERLALASTPNPVALSQASFLAACVAARNDPDPASRQAFLLGPWGEGIAPFLTYEEAAMQVVAQKLAYMYIEPGQIWPLAVTDSLADGGPPSWADGSPVGYAKRYRVAAVLPQADGAPEVPINLRLNAFLLLPQSDAEGDPDPTPGPAIILFRGTAFSNSDVLTAAQPRGLVEDVDRAGVGYSSFGANAAALLDWVASAQAAGRGVVLVGHSLGATMATRLLASLSPEAQAHTRLLAFAPPGVEASCADDIITQGGAQVTTIFHSGDYVPLAGSRLPPGRVLEVGAPISRRSPNWSDILLMHTYPYLAGWQLGWSGDPHVTRWQSDLIVTDTSGVSESARIAAGSLVRAVIYAGGG